MENYIDPAGFDITEPRSGVAMLRPIAASSPKVSSPATPSPATCTLQVVAETAFTKTRLFVAMPSEAARNGDYALPTVFLSVQSDE